MSFLIAARIIFHFYCFFIIFYLLFFFIMFCSLFFIFYFSFIIYYWLYFIYHLLLIIFYLYIIFIFIFHLYLFLFFKYSGPHTTPGIGPGFFIEYGRPEMAVAEGKTILFWSDEWRKVLSGSKAVGNHVQVYLHEPSSVSVGGQVQGLGPGLGLGVWRKGQVIEYSSVDDKHRILLEPREGSSLEVPAKNVPQSVAAEHSSEGLSTSFLSESDTGNIKNKNTVKTDNGNTDGKAIIKETNKIINEKELKVENNITNNLKNKNSIIWESRDTILISFDNVKMFWCDNYSRQNYNNNNNNNNNNNKNKNSTNSVQVPLMFSALDVGGFCRVWWSRYHRFFYGRVVAYNSVTKEHKITYEDGDTRTYDMTTKIYECINLPHTFSLGSARDDATRAQMVASWHAKIVSKGKSAVVCVFVCVRERERERVESESSNMRVCESV